MATKTKFGNNHFATGHFKLVIDGKPVTAHIHGVEGGLISAAAVEEAVGQYNLRGRHLGTREVEALSLEFGMSGSKWVLDTIDKFIANRQTKRFSGEVIHGDTNMTAQYFYTFSDALVTEVSNRVGGIPVFGLRQSSADAVGSNVPQMDSGGVLESRIHERHAVRETAPTAA